MKTAAAAPAAAARGTSSATPTAAPPVATTGATTSASKAVSCITGAESAGDIPQGKSDVVQSHQDGGFYPPAAVSHRTREQERDEETGTGV
jgi:hypothetical protein